MRKASTLPGQIALFCLFPLLLIGLFSGCSSQEPEPDSIIVLPSPVHILAGEEGDEVPSLTVEVYLKEKHTDLAHVWLDVVASAKFGTQTLAAGQEMQYVGQTRTGLSVFKWEIPGYLMETDNVEDLSTDEIQFFVRAENLGGRLVKLEKVVGFSRDQSDFLLVKPASAEVLSAVGHFGWQITGKVENNDYGNRLLLCRSLPSESVWNKKGCQEVPVDHADLLAGGLEPPTSLNLKDGAYWWVIQRMNPDGDVVYQSAAELFFVDAGNDEWVGIRLNDQIALHSPWFGEKELTWRLYRDGVLLTEQDLAGDLSWDMGEWLQAPGFYELLVAPTGQKQTSSVSNLLSFTISAMFETLTLQEEFLLSDAEVEALSTLMEELMTLPADEVETFVTRMAFQGVVNADKLRSLLDELGLKTKDIKLMAERGQTAELTRIFAQAYSRDIFEMSALQQGLSDYIGSD